MINKGDILIGRMELPEGMELQYPARNWTGKRNWMAVCPDHAREGKWLMAPEDYVKQYPEKKMFERSEGNKQRRDELVPSIFIVQMETFKPKPGEGIETDDPAKLAAEYSEKSALLQAQIERLDEKRRKQQQSGLKDQLIETRDKLNVLIDLL